MTFDARRISAVWVAIAVCAAVPATALESVMLPASRDATLVESDAGTLGDGQGPYLRVGATNQSTGGLRRGLVMFAVAEAIPSGSEIVGATLILHMSGNNVGPEAVGVYRVESSWGEGGSAPGGGSGAAAAPGDATWVHRFHNPADPGTSPAWDAPGGDFDASPLAETIVADQGYYDWSSPGLVADVQAALDDPVSGHGWILLGNEDALGSVKRFESRENSLPALRPALLVEFEPPAAGDDECDDTHPGKGKAKAKGKQDDESSD